MVIEHIPGAVPAGVRRLPGPGRTTSTRWTPSWRSSGPVGYPRRFRGPPTRTDGRRGLGNPSPHLMPGGVGQRYIGCAGITSSPASYHVILSIPGAPWGCRTGCGMPSPTATRSSASSGAAAWPRSTSPRTSGTTARSRSRCCIPELAATLGPERFQREIRLAARLQHPHILTVHDSGESRRPALVHHAVRRGRDRSATGSGASGSSGRGRAPDRRARRPGRSSTPTSTASSTATSSPRTCCSPGTAARWWPTSASPGRSGGRTTQLTADRHGGRHAGLHEPGAGERATRRSTPAPTSTASAACCTRCWPASRRSPARRRRRSSPSASADPVPSVRQVRPERAGARGRRRCSGRWRRWRPTGSPRAAEFARALQRRRRHVADSAPPRRPRSRHRRPRPRPPERRRLPVAAVTLVLGLPHRPRRAVRLAAHAPRRRGRSAGAKRLAVLPFENLGDSADAYFADGVTDEVRGKLSQLAGLAGHRPRQLERVPAHDQAAAADRPRAGRRLPAHRHGAVGEARRTATSRVRVSPELVG